MLFSEVYSAYYRAAALLIERAAAGALEKKNAVELIRQRAFQESFVYILDAIQNEQWQIITRDWKTPIRHPPTCPVTLLELRFLKAISLDPRFALFHAPIEGLEEVEPLYRPADFYRVDAPNDPDPFENAAYRAVFDTVLAGLRGKKMLEMTFTSKKGALVTWVCAPHRLEYSEKDDRFRLLCAVGRKGMVVNLASVSRCALLDKPVRGCLIRPPRSSVTLSLVDRRNALERAMLHFAPYEKQTRQTGEDTYELILWYPREEETQVVIRVLSFGPAIRALAPAPFVKEIRRRLECQRKLEETPAQTEDK